MALRFGCVKIGFLFIHVLSAHHKFNLNQHSHPLITKCNTSSSLFWDVTSRK